MSFSFQGFALVAHLWPQMHQYLWLLACHWCTIVSCTTDEAPCDCKGTQLRFSCCGGVMQNMVSCSSCFSQFLLLDASLLLVQRSRLQYYRGTLSLHGNQTHVSSEATVCARATSLLAQSIKITPASVPHLWPMPMHDSS